MRTPSSSILPAAVAVVALAASASFAADLPPPGGEKLETQKLTDNLWVITGAGGNVAVMTGATGTFIVDDVLAPVSAQLKKVIATVAPKPVRIVFNTHWHGDHTGGNAVLGSDGAIIVAHDNVRKRLSTEQFVSMMNKTVPPSPEPALPVITFADSLSFHLDGDDIQVVHVEPAHTDGDSLVFFKKANVLHMGDTFTWGGWPYIDLGSGGSVDGYVRAADRALAMVQPTTRIIPGHGPVGDAKRLKAYRDMIVTIRDRIKKLAASGKSLAQIQAAKPTAEYDAEWGHAFITPDQLVETLYKDLTKKR